MKLTIAKIRAAKPADQTTGNRRHARYGDGRGLWLMVDPNGRKTWAFLYTINKKRRHMGLGSIDHLTLDQARDEALRLRGLVKRGIDPLAVKEAERAANLGIAPVVSAAKRVPTFDEVVEKVLPQRTAKMTNEKAKAQWCSTLETYAYPKLKGVPVNQITPSDLAGILEGLWSPTDPNERAKVDTGMKLKQRIRIVLDYAARHDWLGETALAKLSRTMADFKKGADNDKEGHKSMPAADAPAFMARLREKHAISAKALQFLILTGARSGQVRGATWDEIDLERALWTASRDRMKKRHSDHRVPLAPAAVALLRSLHREEASNLVFPSPTKAATPMSDNTLNKIMSDMGEEAVPHGFRATISTWAAERGYDSQLIEASLHHKDTNKVRAAYQRTDFLDRRKPMMDEWAAFLEGEAAHRAYLTGRDAAA
ncbi:site-specific integrase [uncultured Sphingomonas sp.]|uniref:tyrosine-type recombinase/integrase n=1 Tax=uncultured Sphingomonas sp. TaxID=158754 RepID=UPI0025CE134F|nr:site-specific integrase [uncultured Sphingomonas sp.]